MAPVGNVKVEEVVEPHGCKPIEWAVSNSVDWIHARFARLTGALTARHSGGVQRAPVAAAPAPLSGDPLQHAARGLN